MCFESLKKLYEDGNLLRILYACGFFGDLNSAILRAIDDKVPDFLKYLKDQFCIFNYDEEIKENLLKDRIEVINKLYDKINELKPEINEKDKVLKEIISELIQKYKDLK